MRCPVLGYLVLVAFVPPHLLPHLAIPVDAIIAVKARFIHLSLAVIKVVWIIFTMLADTSHTAHVLPPLNSKLVTYLYTDDFRLMFRTILLDAKECVYLYHLLSASTTNQHKTEFLYSEKSSL